MKTVVTIPGLFIVAAAVPAIETADFRAASWEMTRMTREEAAEPVTGGMLELIAEWETGRSTIRLYTGQSSECLPPLINLRYSRR